MNIRWTEIAQQDRDDAIDYLLGESPLAALLVDRRIDHSLLVLYQYPFAGRVGRAPGTRELVIGDAPYIAVYEVDGDNIVILRLVHTARRPLSSD